MYSYPCPMYPYLHPCCSYFPMQFPSTHVSPRLHLVLRRLLAAPVGILGMVDGLLGREGGLVGLDGLFAVGGQVRHPLALARLLPLQRRLLELLDLELWVGYARVLADKFMRSGGMSTGALTTLRLAVPPDGGCGERADGDWDGSLAEANAGDAGAEQ